MLDVLKNRNMDQVISSDCNPTMAASKIFNNILDQIQNSRQNFHLQLSPFSAIISLKKTIVKDRFGIPIVPPSSTSPQSSMSPNDFAILASKNLKLESDLATLHHNYEVSVDDCAAAHAKIKLFESQHQIKTEAEDFKKSDVKVLKHQIEQLAKENEYQRSEIEELKVSKSKSKEAFERLNKKYNESRTSFCKEKSLILKHHKADIKSANKDLGEAIKLRIKAEEELEKSQKSLKSCSTLNTKETSITSTVLDSSLIPDSDTPQTNSKETCCTICAHVIVNYVPEYIFETEMGPACDSCKPLDKPNSIISINPITSTIPPTNNIFPT